MNRIDYSNIIPAPVGDEWDEPPRPEPTKDELWRKALSGLGVPAVYLGVPESLALPATLDGWSGDPWAVTLIGPTGCGKTWLAVRLLVKADGMVPKARDRSRSLFCDAALAVARIQEEIGTATEGRTFDALRRATVLLVDDLGAERGTDYQRERLGLILRERYNEQRPTIITSNAAKIDDVVEPRLASRLAAGVIPVTGRDRRLAK